MPHTDGVETSDPIAEATRWITSDLLSAQRILSKAQLPDRVPAHVEVITDILDSDTYTREWRTTVAAAVLAARAAAG